MLIEYRTDASISVEEFADVLNRSTLGTRRPVEDAERLQQMLDHGNILVTAWDGNKLVGVSRALTDFSFCAYLSDLAVDESYQHQGIGKRLVEITRERAGKQTSLILLAVPEAVNYYPKIGMEAMPRCFWIPREI